MRITLVWSRSQLSAENLAGHYGPDVVIAHAASSNDPDLLLESARDALRVNRSEIDAVIIALPIPQLCPYTRMVVDEGIHVLAEKPLATDIESAKQLLREAAVSKAMHAVAENYRFETVFKKAHDMLEESCGELIAVQLTAQTPIPPGSRYGRGWRLDLSGTGMLGDGMVHHLAGMRVVIGADIDRVCAVCTQKSKAFSGPDTVNGVVQFSNGLSGSVFATYAGNTFSWELRVVGTTGDIIVQRTFPKPGYKLSVIRKVGGENEVSEEQIPFSGIEAEFNAFMQSCRDGNLHPDLEGQMAFNEVATVCALLDSSKSGEWVDVERWVAE